MSKREPESNIADRSRIHSANAEDPVKSAIIEILSSGVKSAKALKAEAISSSNRSPECYYRKLAELRDTERLIDFVQDGRERYYSLWKDRDKLAQFVTRRRNRLIQHIVVNAHYLLEVMMREATDRTREARAYARRHEVSMKSSLLYKAVLELKEDYPAIPVLPEEAHYHEDDGTYEMEITEWYGYWLSVLKFFREL